MRFLYNMPRFSEDLDFSLAKPNADDDFTSLLKQVKKTFEAEDYNLSIKAKTDKTVKSAFVKFNGLLYDIGVSPHQSETISIKVEIDTNPPAGAGMETSIVRKYCMLNLQHYDKSSLLAGKLHALLNRRYVKGRDVYDLVWYLSDRSWPGPNITLLNNALQQTGWNGSNITDANWKSTVAETISEFDWKKVLADVQPFIERQQDIPLLKKENVIQLLGT